MHPWFYALFWLSRQKLASKSHSMFLALPLWLLSIELSGPNGFFSVCPNQFDCENDLEVLL